MGVYGYEFFLDEEVKVNTILEGESVKDNTNEYFLPTSTTNQIVHHEGYSLSYNEDHEQAEWVAYELKKSHLSKTNFERPYFEIDDAVKTGAANWRNYKTLVTIEGIYVLREIGDTVSLLMMKLF